LEKGRKCKAVAAWNPRKLLADQVRSDQDKRKAPEALMLIVKKGGKSLLQRLNQKAKNRGFKDN